MNKKDTENNMNKIICFGLSNKIKFPKKNSIEIYLTYQKIYIGISKNIKFYAKIYSYSVYGK